MATLEQRGLPAVWRSSVAEALAVIDLLDARIAQLDAELGPIARADPCVQLLVTIAGIGEPLGLVMAAEIAASRGSPDRATSSVSPAWRHASLSKGQSSRIGPLSKPRLACAAVSLPGARFGARHFYLCVAAAVRQTPLILLNTPDR